MSQIESEDFGLKTKTIGMGTYTNGVELAEAGVLPGTPDWMAEQMVNDHRNKAQIQANTGGYGLPPLFAGFLLLLVFLPAVFGFMLLESRGSHPIGAYIVCFGPAVAFAIAVKVAKARKRKRDQGISS